MDGVTGREAFENSLGEDVVVSVGAAQNEALNIPGGDAYLSADFVRTGYDLTLKVDGAQAIVIPDYFMSDTPPDLHLGTGTVISGALAGKLAGPMAPGQYAQIGAVGLGEPIGSVTDLDGSVQATRADGTQITLGTGDAVFQGDVIETGAKSSIGVVFADDTTFSLDADGRMVLDEMVYDPDAQTGVFEATVVKGVFSFVSGQVAKTGPDSMVLHTPKTTIGIRGSTGLVKSGVNGGEDLITLVPDIDGNLGELIVSNQAGFQVLSQANASTSVFSAFQPPSPVVFMSPQELQQNFGGTLTVLVRTEAKKAVVKAQQATQKAEQAEQQAAQQQEEAAAAEEEAAQADEEAAAAEAEAAAAQAEAEAAAAEAEAAVDPEAKAAAEAKVAEAEVKLAAAEAKAATQSEAADAKATEAAAKAAGAADAAQQAEAAVTAQQQAQEFSQMAGTAAELQQQVFTQFIETGVVDPTLVPQGPAPGQPGGPDGGPEGGPDGGPEDGDAAAEQAYQEAMAAGATPEEAFEAAALAASGGNLDDPAVDVARAAFEEAIANGATPEEAMLAAQQAAEAFSFQQQAGLDPNAPPPPGGEPGQFDPNAPRPDGPLDPNAPQAGPGEGPDGGPGEGDLPPIDPNLTPEENFEAIAMAASGGNMDDPAVAAARAAFQAAIESGASPDQAMQLAMQAAGGGGFAPQGQDFGAQGGFAPPPPGSGPQGMIYFGEGGQAFTSTGDPHAIYFAEGGGAVSGINLGSFENDIYYGGEFQYEGPVDGYAPVVFYVPVADGTYTVINQDEEYQETVFAQTIIAVNGGGSLTGGTGNTNFYFPWLSLKDGAGGTYTVTDAGGVNQISFDGMENVKFLAAATSATSGTITVYSDALGSSVSFATINYSNISQFLLSDVTITSFSSSTFTTAAGGNVLKLSGLDAGETGFGLAGTTGNDTISVSGTHDSITMGKAGDDTFTITATASSQVLGGDGADTFKVQAWGGTIANHNGFDLNGGAGADVFDYSTWTSPPSLYVYLTSGGNTVRDVADNSTATYQHNLVMDSSDTFKGTSVADFIHVYTANYASIDAGDGNDQFTISAGVTTPAVTGGTGTDTFTVNTGTGNIADLGGASGGESDVLVVVSGATANATINGSFTATSATSNSGTAVITSAASTIGTIDLSAAIGTTGFTINNASATGATTITGSSKNDTITASNYGDTITGGVGNDTLTGGTGADKFIFAATSALNGSDTITGFTAGTDKIDLNAFETVGTLVNVAGATDANAAGEVFYLFGMAAGAADSSTGVIAAVNAAAVWTDTAATSVLVISDDNSTAVYEWTGNNAADEATGDTFTLLATLESAVITAATDIVIA